MCRLKSAGTWCHAEPHLVLGLHGSALAQQRVDNLLVALPAGVMQGRHAVLFEWEWETPGEEGGGGASRGAHKMRFAKPARTACL